MLSATARRVSVNVSGIGFLLRGGGAVCSHLGRDIRTDTRREKALGAPPTGQGPTVPDL